MKPTSTLLTHWSTVILSLFLCLVSEAAFSQSTGRNYIVTRTFTDSTGTTYQDKVDYYDGLGRPEQSVLRNASPDGGDIVTLQEYDNLGRESSQWSPMSISGNAGQYVSPDMVKSRAVSFYGDSRPYSMPVYESSPLNRIQEQYGPGEDWHLHSHSVKTSYLTNVAGNDTLNCICYSVSDSSNDTIITLNRLKNYESSQLFVTRMEDEDGNTSFEFKDKLGQVLLTRSILRQGNSKTILDTYYIYNDFGNLVAVLPPEASDAFRTSTSSSWRSDTDETMARYAFLYKYNSRNLQSAKKLPGCSWTFYVYDKGDRLVFSQDGNQRRRGEWSFSIPDAFGKECFSGTCTNSLNAFSEPLKSVVVKADWLPDATSPAGSGPYKGYSLSGVSLVSPTVLLVNYYNDYSFLGKNGIPAGTDDSAGYDSSAESEGFGKRYTASAQGMLTGMLTARLDNSDSPAYFYTVMYYDSYGRPVQIKSSSHLAGGVEKEYFAYNFVGQPVKKRHIHSANGKPAQTENYTFTYDQAGRLLTTTHQLNDGSPVTLVSNSYDSIGRLIRNSRKGAPALQSDYAYNVRSWMKCITGPLFHQSLYYNDKRSNGTNPSLYNGNISAMDWSVENDKERGYDFSYDGLSRLTGASYLEGNLPNDKFNTSYSYDKHGNMLSLSRHGNIGTSTYGIVDDLTLVYNGNQLVSIEDAATNPSLSMSMDFKDAAELEIEYAYDANGNQTKDLNKGISGIEYNILNLPKRITFSRVNNPVNEYVYSAGGKKLAVIHKSSTEKRTDYVGSMIYENGSLKRILVDGGYIENGIYHFYLQDHLGNNRVVAKSDGTVVQTTHYYPYGMSFAEGTFADKQPYKYNGKELDTENGLNLYDYDARQMEVVSGRFTSVDPMAEMSYSWSPYAYCINNPVNYVDPTGNFSTRFGAWLYKLFHGGDQILKDKGGEYFVSTQTQYLGDEGGVTVERKFDWDGRSAGRNLVFEKQRDAYIADINFQELCERHGMEYVRTESRSDAIAKMLQPVTLTIMPVPLLKSGNVLINEGKSLAQVEKNIAKTPVGRSGNVMSSVAKNSSTTIDGVKFTAHALERMQGRGIISPRAVIDVVRHPAKVLPGKTPGTMIYYKDKLKVITNTSGDIVTVVWH